MSHDKHPLLDLRAVALTDALIEEMSESGVPWQVVCMVGIDLWARGIAKLGIAEGMDDELIIETGQTYAQVFAALLRLRLQDERNRREPTIN